jgi:hypothetical protein
MADQMDLLREQVKLIQGDGALCMSSLKRISEQAAQNPDDPLNQVHYEPHWLHFYDLQVLGNI